VPLSGPRAPVSATLVGVVCSVYASYHHGSQIWLWSLAAMTALFGNMMHTRLEQYVTWISKTPVESQPVYISGYLNYIFIPCF
jgi:hypothetical protein